MLAKTGKRMYTDIRSDVYVIKVNAMERMQFYLDTEVSRKLDILAERMNVSKAELIRRGITLLLQQSQTAEDDPLLKIIGIGEGEPGKVSEEHDRYLADAKLRRRRK